MDLRLRDLPAEGKWAIQQLAQSRTDPARTVERARIVSRAAAGERVPGLAKCLDLNACTVHLWLGRFQAEGLKGLEDRPRSGAPVTYTLEVVGEETASSLTSHKALDLPFGW